MKRRAQNLGLASMEHTFAYRTFGAGFAPKVGHPQHQDIKDGIMTRKTFHDPSICSMSAC